ncbi:MAG: toll/interleukin-1 receptor domain-containing protein [Anaerolinea sp.]|nr:toll/interleukin-1 receptor domain-containing protein [Anaerolinea sp.]
MKLFISYKHIDSDFVHRLNADLTRYGISLWIDSAEVQPSEVFPKRIEEAIIGCDAFLVVLSPESLGSDWVQREIFCATKNHRKIIPILLRDCAVPFLISDIQYIDFQQTGYSEPRYAAAFQKLINILLPGSIYFGGLRPLPDICIKNVYAIPDDNRLRDKRMEELFSEKWDELRLMARTGANYLNSVGRNYRTDNGKGPGIATHLEEGRKFKVLLDYPYKPLEERMLFDLHDAWEKVSHSRVFHFFREYPKQVQINFTNYAPYCSLFFTAKSVIYDPYHVGRHNRKESPGNEFLVFEFEKQLGNTVTPPHDYYTLLDDHFARMWNASITFRELCAKHPDELGKYIPELDALGIK